MEKSGPPLVSVLLPNLNTVKFLRERFETILNQTLTDWELIVVDNYSDDGAWELIQEYASNDPRINVSQAPREGMYANWNNCVRLSQGKYIYIATSDDTMTADCLEKMVRALEEHPECDICHCCLKHIDEDGHPTPNDWFDSRPGQFYGELMKQPHIRMAPYDGILYCALYTVYSSITQLLIRRSVFDKVGLFRTDWGSTGDFEWEMRASLVCNTIHVPDILATWRLYSEQATASFILESATAHANFCDMMQAAFPILQTYRPELFNKLNLRKLMIPYRRQQLFLGMRERQKIFQKMIYLFRFLPVSPSCAAEFFCVRVLGIIPRADDFTYIRNELTRLGLHQNVKCLS